MNKLNHQQEKLKDSMKYICKHSCSNSYKITKAFKINGKSKSFHYGSFKTLDEAIAHRDLCIEREWDEQLMPKNNPLLFRPMKYIQKERNGNYRIVKWENGKMVCYGTYRTLFDAMQERDLLMKNNWDYDLVCEEDERLANTTIFNGKKVGY